jgi:uncharacterized membrane protein YidH (DUF202 family)
MTDFPGDLSTPGSVPGAQPSVVGAADRTDLAWMRSALTFAGVGVAVLKGFKPIGGARPFDGAVAIILGAAVLLMSAGYLRRRRHSNAPVGRSLLLVSAGTMSVGIVALVIGAIR